MARNPQIKLTYDPAKGYRKCIGKWSKDGASASSLKPAKFWLGKDLGLAQSTAIYIMRLWTEQQNDCWSAEALQSINEFRNGCPASNPATSSKTSAPLLVAALPIISKSTQTLQSMITAFIAEIAVSQRSEQWKQVLTARLLAISNNYKAEAIDYAELKRLKDFFLSRPNNWSATTAVNHVYGIKQLIDWLDVNELWTPPRRWKDAFKFNKWQLLSSAERESNAVKAFSNDELHKLYSLANPNLKLYMLLALNCGFTQSELGSLRRKHLRASKANAERYYIDRARNKTGGKIRVKWLLWDVTKVALLKHLDVTNCNKPDSLMFQTMDGNELVYYKSGQRRDAVVQQWRRLLKRAQPVRHLGFKTLRKTGSQLVRTAGGKEMSELYLAHSDTTTGKYYNNGDYNVLAKTLKRVEKQIEHMIADR